MSKQVSYECYQLYWKVGIINKYSQVFVPDGVDIPLHDTSPELLHQIIDIHGTNDMTMKLHSALDTKSIVTEVLQKL